MPQPIVLYEFSEERLGLIRVSKAFHDTFGFHDLALNSRTPEQVISTEYVNAVWDAFRQAGRPKRQRQM